MKSMSLIARCSSICWPQAGQGMSEGASESMGGNYSGRSIWKRRRYTRTVLNGRPRKEYVLQYKTPFGYREWVFSQHNPNLSDKNPDKK